MTRTVAVTGASGFIGGRVVSRLQRDGWQVRALARRRKVAAPDPIETVVGSLDDRQSLGRLVQGVDAVVHIAGVIKARSRRDFFQVNATGTKRLVEAVAEQTPTARFVHISSLAAREPHLSDYAASKRAGEAVVVEAAAGLRWTILRPPAVYGPGDRETLPFFRWVKRGFGPLLGTDDARFSLLHADDLAAAVAVLLEETTPDLILEPDDGQAGGHSWANLVSVAAEQLGATVRPVRVPTRLIHAVGMLNFALRVIPGYVPMLTPGKARELCHNNWVCNAESTIGQTAWRPGFSIGPGFAATIDWYRTRAWL